MRIRYARASGASVDVNDECNMDTHFCNPAKTVCGRSPMNAVIFGTRLAELLRGLR